MTKNRRMNFSENKTKHGIGPWTVLFLALVALGVMGVCTR
jgi:hypothetical protein